MFSPEGPVFYSGTYNGQVVNVAAALKTIEILRDGEVHKKLWGLGDRLSSQINEVADELEINAQCLNFGSIWGIAFSRGPLNNYRDVAGMVRYNKANPKGMALKNTAAQQRHLRGGTASGLHLRRPHRSGDRQDVGGHRGLLPPAPRGAGVEASGRFETPAWEERGMVTAGKAHLEIIYCSV